MYPIYVGADDAQARAEVVEPWHRWRTFALEAMGLLSTQDEAHQRVFNHLTYDSMAHDSRGVFGSPETCTRILKKIIELVGVTHIGLTFHFGGLSQDKVLKSMERFAHQVRPAFALLGAFRASEGPSSPGEVWLHSTVRCIALAALLLAQIFPIFSVVAPCHRSASPASVRHRTFTTGW